MTEDILCHVYAYSEGWNEREAGASSFEAHYLLLRLAALRFWPQVKTRSRAALRPKLSGANFLAKNLRERHHLRTLSHSLVWTSVL